MRLLFVCGRARLRSPTAEQVFCGYDGLETASAGVSADADEPVTAEHLARADILDIPDDYAFMDPGLVRLLEARVTPHLR